MRSIDDNDSHWTQHLELFSGIDSLGAGLQARGLGGGWWVEGLIRTKETSYLQGQMEAVGYFHVPG